MAADVATLRFSTDDLPERDRIAMFRDVIGHKIANLDLEPMGDGPFRCQADFRALPGLAMASIVSSSQHVRRTKELIAADGNNDLILSVPVKGAAFVSQLGREATVADGDAVLLFNAEPGSVSYLSTARILSLRLPADALAPMIADLDAACVGKIPRDGEAIRLLVAYVALLQREHALVAHELRRAVVAHVYDLAALALGATRDAAAIAEDRGVRAARLHAIKSGIVENIGRRDLSVAAVAARHGVTPRYVQRLFEAEGTTFSEFLLGQRLARAHRLLGDPRCAGRTISTIAFDVGFGDLSYFNRTFRRRYGASPSDVREAAQRQSGQ